MIHIVKLPLELVAHQVSRQIDWAIAQQYKVSLVITLTYHGSDKSLIFGRFSCESISYIADFSYHSLPALPPCFTRFNDFKYLSLTHSFYFW